MLVVLRVQYFFNNALILLLFSHQGIINDLLLLGKFLLHYEGSCTVCTLLSTLLRAFSCWLLIVLVVVLAIVHSWAAHNGTLILLRGGEGVATVDLCIIAHELLFLLLDLSVLTGLDHLFLVYYVRMILLRDLLVVNLLLLLRWCLVVVLSVHLVDVVVLHCCSA